MGYKHHKWALQQPVKGATRTLLLILSLKADENDICWGKNRTLAREVNVDKRTIQRSSLELQNLKLIEILKQYRNDGGQRENKFRILVDDGKLTLGHDANVIPLTAQRRPPSDTTVTPTTTTTEFSIEIPLQHHGDELLFPRGLTSEEAAQVGRIVESFSAEIAQQLLDEFAGKLRKGGFTTSPISWFNAIAKRAKNGDFYPALALEISKQRVKSAYSPKNLASATKTATPIGEKAIQSIKDTLKRKA